MYKRQRRHKMGVHNIQCWKNSAVGLVGLLLDDPELVADAVSYTHLTLPTSDLG